MEINVIANDLRQSLRELKKISGISQRQRPKRQAIVGLGLLGGWHSRISPMESSATEEIITTTLTCSRMSKGSPQRCNSCRHP
ncbi:Hypothetical protein FKW44_000257 [Caligus rogercresseyi]|uniref:Uncharacterized protein n=1 Tax=Caligus rogercresseyi TaxID=217165 RepID=A0A7T8QUR4_CALRO|nr:Hypothetical protein FKW44_000257 [Caligus rogercresseyi]